MDWQSWTAAAIALLAACWAGWKILGPIVNEFRKKKSSDKGCGACGGDSACSSDGKQPLDR